MKARLRATPWPPGEPGQKFRDDRLVWLAARPELERAGRPWWLNFLGLGGFGHMFLPGRADGRNAAQANALKRDLGSGRMRRLAMACDEVTPRLSPDELARVRATGELPEWFYVEVIRAWKDR